MRLHTKSRSATAPLRFRDRLRIEYDDAFRTALIRISGHFDKLPSRAWNEIRRDSALADRPWARLLRTIDEACLAGAEEETLLELPAVLTAYIYARRAQLDLTPAEGVVAIPEPMKRAA
jgi:hypothetical protein